MSSYAAKGFNQDRAYTLTIDQVQALRKAQATYRKIAEDPSIRETARQMAAREVARIEGEIRG